MTIAGCRVRVLAALFAGTRRVSVACGGIIGGLIATGLILRKAALIRLICHLDCLLTDLRLEKLLRIIRLDAAQVLSAAWLVRYKFYIEIRVA